MRLLITPSVLGLALLLCSQASAQTFPFLESFDNDTADWRDAGRAALTHVASGGADGGGYVTDDFAFADAGPFGATIFRGESSFNASGNRFVGDWIAAGVEEVTLSVRHNAPIPLAFAARFASPFNFPGSSAISFAPVAPGRFTELRFAIDPMSPQFVTFEGADFATVFSNIGNVQVTTDLPGGFLAIDQALIDSGDAPAGSALGDVFAAVNDLPVGQALFNTSLAITFDLDEVSVTAVPEPAGAGLLMCGLIAAVAPLRPRS